MKVKRRDLIEGCIVKEDIFSQSVHPLVTKKTVITNDILEVLQAFLIEEVSIEKTLENGDPFPNIESHEETIKKTEFTTFYSDYMKAVEVYKTEFIKWQAGSPINILKIRELMIPLLIRFYNESNELLLIHRYTKQENYLYHHSVATGLISGYLALKQNIPSGEAAQVALAGVMADCGLSKVDLKVLNKRKNFSIQEEEEIRKHPLYSYNLLKNIPSLKDAVKLAVLQHHERLDGSGYPLKESAKRVHKFSRIIAVADFYHKMCTGEGISTGLSPFKAVEIMTEDSFGKFDIEIVQVLLRNVAKFSLGSTVKLNDGSIGDVMFVDSKSPLRPIIKVEKTDQLLDLRTNRAYLIDYIIKI
ncbi:HD-GYP domain-containing protein (c-di-GMP phosphodiesterase class II) [Bacillus oleivorans]|uniref:HD-GYP domain-containing protein (C-di-GMP phosphodiesterase class II) n=1 Tax=Bacillus oleivorans TaxID=1448271 RepID=A0A285CGI3_9BACI|nr:HD domain-containing phosphohydrolase [Bacillus oleivorans]SNX66691.1 HD-GYP domain-containing protein (c-di-GMP phosphodiesterase class II) [Bacillus oleivorans]